MSFSWPVRVYYEDTDSAGIVYYANYLKFMERARTELLRSLGFEQNLLREQKNVIFAVRSMQIDYKIPAKFNDELMVTANLIELRKASMLFEQKIYQYNQQDKVLCQGEVSIACIQADTLKPCAIPQSLMEVASVD